jgi:diamine N-acetyltransferase
VLRKLGFVLEGRARSHVVRWERREDLVSYGLLATEWRTARRPELDDVQIRVAQPGDAVELASLAESTFRDAFEADNDPANFAAFIAATYGPAQQRAELEHPDMTTLVAVQGARLVGFAQLRSGTAPPCVPMDRPIIEVQRFYVARAWHGRGLAQALMDRAFATARARGAERVWLGVFEKNPRAIRFYEAQGYADIGGHTFVLGNDPQNDRVMLRTL